MHVFNINTCSEQLQSNISANSNSLPQCLEIARNRYLKKLYMLQTKILKILDKQLGGLDLKEESKDFDST